MFREQRSALQCYREAMISMDQSKANQHLAQAKQHEQKARQCKASMVAEIRKQMKSAGLP
jgi:hypothetical protein